MKRIPSFNDFSPYIIKDIRVPLRIVTSKSPNWDAIVAEWDRLFFQSADNKRASTNIPATLTNLGLLTRTPPRLSSAGVAIAGAPSALEAARLFIKHIVENLNGMSIITGVRSLNAQSLPVNKASLKKELEMAGITNLSNGTTDHQILLNWMIEAGLFSKTGRNNPKPNDSVMKTVLGISGSEWSAFSDLPLNQQIFVQILRRVAGASGTKQIPAKQIIDECLLHHRGHFREDQIRSKIINPLISADWLEAPQAANAGRGGKSGTIAPTAKLLGIPIDVVLPDFDQVIPADLRSKIDTPASEVKRLLESKAKHDRGLGLELLALKMILDIGIEPRAFRLRSRQTAYAEVDLTAEGKNLLFSRWNFQCKCVKSRVSLGDVAKEVGLAIYTKAHVIAVVTTSDFSSEAISYAREITHTSHLQFLFVNGEVVDRYLERGASILHTHIAANAKEVMIQKRGQPISPETGG